MDDWLDPPQSSDDSAHRLSVSPDEEPVDVALATVQNARAALGNRERERARAREVAMRRSDELQRGEVGHEEVRRARMEVLKAMAHVLAAREEVERAEKGLAEAMQRKGGAELKLEVGEDMNVLVEDVEELEDNENPPKNTLAVGEMAREREEVDTEELQHTDTPSTTQVSGTTDTPCPYETGSEERSAHSDTMVLDHEEPLDGLLSLDPRHMTEAARHNAPGLPQPQPLPTSPTGPRATTSTRETPPQLEPFARAENPSNSLRPPQEDPERNLANSSIFAHLAAATHLC